MPRKRLGTSNDQVITVGTLLSDVRAGAQGTYTIPAGREVKIARIIRTPAGRSFRLMNSTTWVQESQIKADFHPSQVFDYTGTHPEEAVPESWKAAKTKKKTNKKNKSDNQTEKGCKRRIRYVTNRHSPIRGVLTGASSMDKQELRKVLQGLQPGDTVSVTFRGEKADKSGEYTVVKTKTGRGKGGSQLVELKTADGELLVTGTPESDDILHVVAPDGTLHGFETEAEVPPTFETDAGGASRLKETFSKLVDAEGQYTVDVESTHEPFNGTFTVLKAVQKRGRYGQVVLTLQAQGSDPFEVWSFRHSGVITSFTVRGEAEETN